MSAPIQGPRLVLRHLGAGCDPRTTTPGMALPMSREREVEVIRGTEKEIVKVKEGGK